MSFFPRALALLFLCCSVWAAHADVILLLEDPVNFEGRFTSAGHSAVWTDRLCTDNHVTLRPCRADEAGVVLSRYGGQPGKLDWLAMPVQQYLYGVDQLDEVPATMTRAQLHELQAAARKRYTPTFAIDPGDKMWVQLTGESYRRRIVLLRVHTTPTQDLHLMDWLNRTPNVSHFNVLAENCSDFVGAILGHVFPHGFHRSYLFDSGIMTPKENLADLHNYARHHPELTWQIQVLPQVPGDLHRSGHVRGVTEAYLKSWWFLLPLDYLLPIELGAVTVSGLSDHRYNPKPTDQINAREFFPQPTAALATH